jgi:hypothetical protein
MSNLNNSSHHTLPLNVDNLVSMFTQKSGVPQSIAAIIIPLVIQFITQKIGTGVAGGFSSGGGAAKAGIGNLQSVLSELGNVGNDHPLVAQVQQKANIQDPQQATQYVQQAVGVMKQEADTNPEGFQSLFGDVLGGMGGGMAGDTAKSIGDKIKGFFGSK